MVIHEECGLKLRRRDTARVPPSGVEPPDGVQRGWRISPDLKLAIVGATFPQTRPLAASEDRRDDVLLAASIGVSCTR